jgi:conjugal transfer pilus assembly protein TraD
MFERVLSSLTIGAGVIVGSGIGLAVLLRSRGLRWTWALLGLPLAVLVWRLSPLLAVLMLFVFGLASVLGARWHHADLLYGADLAEAAHARSGVLETVRNRQHARRFKEHGWIRDGWLAIGRDQKGHTVSMPIGYESGSHTLVLGATGGGKTVSEAWIASRLIEHGHGAVVIDPKGDDMLRKELKTATGRRGAQFLEWTPEGPCAYNPYAHGTAGEIADKALAGEVFTEPHYLRQGQRYVGHAVRVMQRAGVPVTPASLAAHMVPVQLEVTARQLPEEPAAEVQAYLDSLSDRQRRELAGVRDRLAILAESETGHWLEPLPGRPLIDIEQAVRNRSVVYFRLDSDRRLLLTTMIAAAIVIDLITLVGRLQTTPVPTVVMLDEFAAIAAEPVARLFGRSRSAGLSLILGTQELADLQSVREGLREQVLGNIATLIAHRQNVPESAELIAGIAGTKAVWVTTEQTDDALIGVNPSGRGTRRRGYEYAIHPGRFKSLATGEAVLITPGSSQPPALIQVRHPYNGHR